MSHLDKFGDWADGIASRYGLSAQLTIIWLEQKGITKPRRLGQNERASLIHWAKVQS